MPPEFRFFNFSFYNWPKYKTLMDITKWWAFLVFADCAWAFIGFYSNFHMNKSKAFHFLFIFKSQSLVIHRDKKRKERKKNTQKKSNFLLPVVSFIKKIINVYYFKKHFYWSSTMHQWLSFQIFCILKITFWTKM